MKKMYFVPEIKAVNFAQQDIVTSSDPWVDDGYEPALFGENG